MLLTADNGIGVALYITNSSFIDSHSIVGAGCIQVIGNLSLGAEISNSTLQYCSSRLSAILTLAHHSGQFFLTNLTMLDIENRETSLIMIMTPTPTCSNLAETIVKR